MTNETDDYCTIMKRMVTPEGMALKVYTTAKDTGRTTGIGWLWLGSQALDEMRQQIDRAANQAAQPMLPPWDQQGSDNVRWLPPQP